MLGKASLGALAALKGKPPGRPPQGEHRGLSLTEQPRKVMMIDEELLAILACPEDKSPVSLAGGELIEQINAGIRAGLLSNRGGSKVSNPIDGGLVRADGQWLYPIRDEIPVMLIDEAIALPPPSAG